MLTMADLEPQIVEVSIHIVEGDDSSQRIVKLRMLSYSEFWEIGEAVPYPAVPEVPKVVSGVKKYVRDEQDVDYLAAVAAVNNERSMRRLAVCVVGGGNLPELADKPVAEQAAALGRLPHSMVLGLNAAMNRLHRMSHAEVVAKSNSFQRVPGNADGDLQANGLEPGGVAQFAGGGAG